MTGRGECRGGSGKNIEGEQPSNDEVRLKKGTGGDEMGPKGRATYGLFKNSWNKIIKVSKRGSEAFSF